MTERKTLNRYYPPDYDPSKIPKLKQSVKDKNRLWGIRVMAPFNMKCNTCGEYIYKGKKFNSKKETVENMDYLGIQLHRFYIRCPKCVAVIAFRTDPENCDYTLEAGATRNFEAAKTLQTMIKKEQEAIEEEEANNPMKVLENRMKQSQNEMNQIETLKDLQETNSKHAKLNHEEMILKMRKYEEALEKLQDEEDEKLVKSIFKSPVAEEGKAVYKKLPDPEPEDKPTTSKSTSVKRPLPSLVSKSSKKAKLNSLVKKKGTTDGSNGHTLLGNGSSASSQQSTKESPKQTNPGSTGSSTISQSSAGPSSAGPSAAGPSSAGPSAAGSSSAGPSAAGSSSARPIDQPATGSLGLLCGYAESDDSD